MPQLFGRFYRKRELLEHIGRLEQVGGIRRFVLDEGNEKGVEHIQVRTGAGLCYYVSPMRGMDISFAEMNGVPLTFQSANRDAHPSYYDANGAEWLRTFPGGLMHTCGLSTLGEPSLENGEALGLHGRISHQPASQVGTEGSWDGDDYVMKLTGTVRQTRAFGENIELRRTIISRLGENKIVVRDQIENQGFTSTDLMVLYHCNFGFPFIGPGLTIKFPEGIVKGRESDLTMENYQGFEPPSPSYKERVYYHRPNPQISKPAVILTNQELGLAVTLSYSGATLPCLVQWKMAGQGLYALGIEPANAYVEGRPVERSKRGIVQLGPGETLDYELVFEFNQI